MDKVKVDDIEMAYDIVGVGPPLLLIAGTGYPGATWLPPFVEPLAERCTVIRFDHRGTGASTSTPGPYSTRQFASDAAGLCEALGFTDGVHALGHSMGGRVAQWLAIDWPSTVRSLVLAASGPGQYRAGRPLTRGLPQVTMRHMIEAGYEGYMREHIAETFFTEEFAASSPEVVRALVDAFWENRPTLEDYLKHIVARQQHQTAERLHEITQPALVLVGDEDTGVRGTGSHLEQSQYLAEHLPDAELHVLEGVSHGYFWQWPGRIADVVLAWIERQEGVG